MTKNLKSVVLLPVSIILIALMSACGGGGGSSNGGGGGGGPIVTAPAITTNSVLHSGLKSSAYSVTFTATGGRSPLKWSIDFLVPGLSLDANTGVLSGTITASASNYAMNVTVTDADARTSSRNFTMVVGDRLVAAMPSREFAVSAYQPLTIDPDGIAGGISPFSYALAGGSLPAGVQLSSSGTISGTPTATGTYTATITTSDSYSPPQSVTQQLKIVVNPAALAASSSVPDRVIVNRPVSGKVAATGGTPPYTFAIYSGIVPAGIADLDPSAGIISGVPTQTGDYNFQVKVTDSSAPVQSAFAWVHINVVTPLGRNDTVQTATPIGNGGITASISPYSDPPDGTPIASETDYYKLTSQAGSIVHVETVAKRLNPYKNTLLDTVIEIVDANGFRLSTCRQPGSTATTYTSSCLNDDLSASPHVQDSALDFKVPDEATTFYVHVLDCYGAARPDMIYRLDVSGVTAPKILVSQLAAARGTTYSQLLSADNVVYPVTWSVESGSLPAGIELSAGGYLNGTPTANGTYTFTVRVSDSSSPARTAVGQITLQVVDPITVTSPDALPDACVNQPYTYSLQATGGVPPLKWSSIQMPQGLFMYSSGVISGTPTTTGTAGVGVLVASNTGNLLGGKNMVLTIKTCP